MQCDIFSLTDKSFLIWNNLLPFFRTPNLWSKQINGMLRINETTPFKVELDSTRVESLLRNLLKYWFTLRHFTINNPVGNSNSIPSSTTLGSGSGSASGLVSSTLSSVSSSFSLVSSSATDSRTLIITQNQTAQNTVFVWIL